VGKNKIIQLDVDAIDSMYCSSHSKTWCYRLAEKFHSIFYCICELFNSTGALKHDQTSSSIDFYD